MTRVLDEVLEKPVLSRRQFVRLSVIGGATLLLPPGCQDAQTPPPDPGIALPRYFTEEERRALARFADYVLPPDEQPGGAALGTVEYIERLLTAFEYDPPLLYADGPFSDRNAVPLPDGSPSNVHPENSFTRFLPLTREQEISWRLTLYGSAGTPGGATNDKLLGPIVGWRELCRSGLADAAQLAGQPVDTLDADGLDNLWPKLRGDFVNFFVPRLFEAVFGAPEYGGNRELAGWKLAHYDGDTLPLGYTFYDEAKGRYVERLDAPVSTANLGPDPDPMDEETHIHFKLVAAALGGRIAP